MKIPPQYSPGFNVTVWPLLTLVLLYPLHELTMGSGTEGNGSVNAAIWFTGGIEEFPSTFELPTTTPITWESKVPPPSMVMAEELVESTYAPQSDGTVAVPATVSAPSDESSA